jgi:hypothetical protein
MGLKFKILLSSDWLKDIEKYIIWWIYCHLSGVPWLIIEGSGSDDWIYSQLLVQYLLITLNYVTCLGFRD